MEWHFGGGPTYCTGCAAAGQPCANGEPGADGRLCPYVEHEPRTLAGWQAWDVVIRGAGQLRLAPSGTGVLGLDLGALLALGIALGYEPTALAELLPAAEAGAVAALNQRLSEGTP